MAKLEVKNLKLEKVSDITLNDSIWKNEVNEDAVKKMIRLQLAATRQGTHKTKTRSEVSGGGRKPWRQKGTGRARQGSIRATQWVGGGIAHGVTPRDYGFKINKKERALALKSALSDKMKNKSVVVFDNLNVDSLKTKEIVKLLDAAKLNGKVLFVTASDAENLYMATRNLQNAYTTWIEDLNVLDIVYADVVVFESEAVKRLEEGISHA